MSDESKKAFGGAGEMRYDAGKQDLHVRFPRDTEPHIYHDVPQDKADALFQADSLGGHFVKHIRNAHKFTAPGKSR